MAPVPVSDVDRGELMVGRGQRLPLRWRRAIAVAVGGALGGAGRIGLSAWFAAGQLPWATFAANVSGALALGYLLTRFLRAAPRTTLTIPLVCTGLLGSFTTFSALSLETWQLAEGGQLDLAVGYALGSAVCGLAAAGTGIRLAERRT